MEKLNKTEPAKLLIKLMGGTKLYLKSTFLKGKWLFKDQEQKFLHFINDRKVLLFMYLISPE